VDMEHFFDGFKSNPEFSLRVLEAAIIGGATHLVLCDTNGGSLPSDVLHIVGEVKKHIGDDATIGIHCHDDTGCAVANSLAAVQSGARHVQGTLNGLGERTGNTNLTTVIPNLQLKMGYECLPEGRLERLTAVSNYVAEVLNTRFLVSEMAGRATITMKAEELGLTMDGPAVNQVIDDLKRLEHEGYHFEAADASLELLMRRASGWQQNFFSVESMRVITDESSAGTFTTEATVKVWIGDHREVRVAEGNGPVNAIDTALRAALLEKFPQLSRVHLTDYKVRILDSGSATGAVTRVLLDASDGERNWTTIGVSSNIIEASWRALEESLIFGLLHSK